MTGIINTLFVGKVLHHLPVVDSTNRFALILLSKSKPPEGTAILTYNQTEGKGQIGNSWESEAGKNIALSVIFYPSFLSPHLQFRLSIAVSLAVFDTLSPVLAPDLKIKWPNDIMAGNRKISGILIQNSLSAAQVKYSVAGIGMNVNQSFFSSALPHAGSLFLHTHKTWQLDEIVQALCSNLEKRYLQLRAGHHSEQKENYLNHLFRFREDASYKRQNGKQFQGIITGITETGKLIVQTDTGEESFDFKEISFLLE